jgi:hypothetical protein
MATSRLIPGFGFIVETLDEDKLLPGFGFIVETEAAAGISSPLINGGILLNGGSLIGGALTR